MILNQHTVTSELARLSRPLPLTGRLLRPAEEELVEDVLAQCQHGRRLVVDVTTPRGPLGAVGAVTPATTMVVAAAA